MHVLASRVLLRPSDFPRSLAFYEEGLGLVRFREWGQAPHRGVVFFLGGGYLEMTEAGGAGARPAPGHAPGPCVRLWLQVADAASARQELSARGVAIVEEPQRKPWGLIEFTVHDPDGLPLVVVETPEDHPLRRDQRD